MTKDPGHYLPELLEASRQIQRRQTAPDPELTAAHRRGRKAVADAIGADPDMLADEINSAIESALLERAKHRAAAALAQTRTVRLFNSTAALRLAATDLTHALRAALKKESNE